MDIEFKKWLCELISVDYKNLKEVRTINLSTGNSKFGGKLITPIMLIKAMWSVSDNIDIFYFIRDNGSDYTVYKSGTEVNHWTHKRNTKSRIDAITKALEYIFKNK